jgi:hypothetical protein
MVEAQKYIGQNYPDKKTKILSLEGQDLEGHLDLSEFTNLEELDCSCNELTSLNLSKCVNLKKLNCSINLLDNLDFLNEIPNPERLIFLDIDGCGAFVFPKKMAEILRRFVSLPKQEKEVVIEKLFCEREEKQRRLEELEKEVIELKKFQKENLREIKYLKEKSGNLTRNEFRQLIGLQSQLKDESKSEDNELIEKNESVISELIDFNIKSGEVKRERGNLLKKFVEEYSPAESDQAQKMAEFEEELQKSNGKIEELNKNFKISREKNSACCQDLSKEIEEKKRGLEQEKKKVIEKEGGKVNKYYSEKIEKLLRIQTEEVRYSDSTFIFEAKEELLAEIERSLTTGKIIRDKLGELCKEQAKITKLEIWLESSKKLAEIVSADYIKEEKLQETEKGRIILQFFIEQLQECSKNVDQWKEKKKELEREKERLQKDLLKTEKMKVEEMSDSQKGAVEGRRKSIQEKQEKIKELEKQIENEKEMVRKIKELQNELEIKSEGQFATTAQQVEIFTNKMYD